MEVLAEGAYGGRTVIWSGGGRGCIGQYRDPGQVLIASQLHTSSG